MTQLMLYGIDTSLLKSDPGARSCIAMVGAVWAILTLMSVILLTATLITHFPSAAFLDCCCGLILCVFQLTLYRKMICMALFSHVGGFSFALYFIASTLMLMSACVPAFATGLTINMPSALSFFQQLSMNADMLSFALLLTSLITAINAAAALALVLSCRRHRGLALSIFKH